MKNRKTILVAFMLVACMVVGVGYAAITGSLEIKGSASLEPQLFNVVFTAAKATTIHNEENDGHVPVVKVENEQLVLNTAKTLNNIIAVSMTVSGLACEEDVVTVEFTIKNNNKVPMTLTPVITGNSVFSVEGTFGTNGPIAAGATETYTVTVKLTNDAFDTKQTEGFTITLSGTSVTA